MNVSGYWYKSSKRTAEDVMVKFCAPVYSHRSMGTFLNNEIDYRF